MDIRQTSKLLFALLAILILGGCGPGFRVSKSSFEYLHPATQWVYHTGWQTVRIGSPLPPMAMPFSNVISNVEIKDDRIVVYENAEGDFGKGEYYPKTDLELTSGKTLSRVNATVKPTIEKPSMQPLPRGEPKKIEENLYLIWTNEKDLHVWVGQSLENPKETMILQRRGFGIAGGYVLAPDRRLLVLWVIGQRPMSIWDADTYLFVIDLNKVSSVN